MRAEKLLDPANWQKWLSATFEFSEGWMLASGVNLLFGQNERLLELPEQWLTRCPEQETFLRDKLHGVLVSARSPNPDDEAVTIFLQRGRAWPGEEILRLQEYALLLAFALAYRQQKEAAEQAERQALEENRMLGVGHIASRLGKEMQETLAALPPPENGGSDWEKLQSLTDQLVAYARRSPAALERIHLHKLLEEALRIVQKRVEECGALVSVESPLPVTVLGRPVEMRKLLVDLLLLALRPGRDAFLEVRLTFDASHATFQVSGQDPPEDRDTSEWTVCQEIARLNNGQLTRVSQGLVLKFPLAADAESVTETLDVSLHTVGRRVPYVCVTRGPLASMIVSIDQSEMRLGRSEDCEIVVPYNGVSRIHAALELEPGDKVKIRDLNSTNGTFVNSVRIEEDRPLKEGDTIVLGTEFEMVFGYR